MSDLFLKNNIPTESSFNVSNILNKDNNNKQFGGVYSATSSANLSKVNVADIQNLISMLTSESANHTSTAQLQNKLVNQEGGADLENKLEALLKEEYNFNDNINTELLENKINNIINQTGGNSNTEMLQNQNGGLNYIKPIIGLAGLGLTGTVLKSFDNVNDTEKSFSVSEIVNKSTPAEPVFIKQESVSVINKDAGPTTKQEAPVASPIGVTTTTMMPEEFSATGSEMPQQDIRINQLKKATAPVQQEGGNDALDAFREIIRYVSKELDVKWPKAMKIAAVVNKDVKAENPDIKHSELFEAAKKEFNKNKSKYEKLV
jgi:hypothetical protein